MNETEALLTSAFWQLLEEKPYKKITVRDIVDRCQVNRNTFYYHFEGIPALMVRVLSLWTDEVLKDPRITQAPLLALLPLADAVKGHQKAVMNLKNSRAWEDAVLPCLKRYCERSAALYVKATFGASGAAESRDIPLLTRFYQAASFGCVMDWVDRGMETDLSQDILRVLSLNDLLPKQP